MGITEPYHKIVSTIRELIEKNNLWFDYLEHKPVQTSEQAARIRPAYSLAQGAKALIIRVKKQTNDKFFVMIVIPGDLKFNIDKVKTYFNAKDIRFANEDEINTITDKVKIGGIPPFGNLFGLKVFADNKLFDHEKIIFNAGDRRVSISILSKDYKILVNPIITDLT